MGLRNGDRLTIEITDKDEALIKVVEREEATQMLLKMLEKPPSMGRVIGKLTSAR